MMRRIRLYIFSLKWEFLSLAIVFACYYLFPEAFQKVGKIVNSENDKLWKYVWGVPIANLVWAIKSTATIRKSSPDKSDFLRWEGHRDVIGFFYMGLILILLSAIIVVAFLGAKIVALENSQAGLLSLSATVVSTVSATTLWMASHKADEIIYKNINPD